MIDTDRVNPQGAIVKSGTRRAGRKCLPQAPYGSVSPRIGGWQKQGNEIVSGRIDGSLWIKYNSSLKNLDGTDNLSSVGGFLSIVDNPSLEDLNGLSNLSFVGGDLYIEKNNKL